MQNPLDRLRDIRDKLLSAQPLTPMENARLAAARKTIPEHILSEFGISSDSEERRLIDSLKALGTKIRSGERLTLDEEAQLQAAELGIPQYHLGVLGIPPRNVAGAPQHVISSQPVSGIISGPTRSWVHPSFGVARPSSNYHPLVRPDVHIAPPAPRHSLNTLISVTNPDLRIMNESEREQRQLEQAERKENKRLLSQSAADDEREARRVQEERARQIAEYNASVPPHSRVDLSGQKKGGKKRRYF